MSLLIAVLAAVSAILAFQVMDELRERSLARARIYGPKPKRKAWSELRAEFEARLQEKLPSKLKTLMQDRLALAGDARSPGSLALSLLLGCFGGVLLGLVLGLGSSAWMPGALGLALPPLSLQDKCARRQAELRRQLPDALDLLTACVEAGLGFDQALARVASRLKAGVLQAELENTVSSLGLGASRREALRSLEKRLRLEELSQLVAALLQADKRGAPLGPALRAQSGQLRRLRTLRVKKLAAEAPLKMLFPLMVFILPVVFIVLFGPIILKWKAGVF